MNQLNFEPINNLLEQLDPLTILTIGVLGTMIHFILFPRLTYGIASVGLLQLAAFHVQEYYANMKAYTKYETHIIYLLARGLIVSMLLGALARMSS
jgi:hypothetical protein